MLFTAAFIVWLKVNTHLAGVAHQSLNHALYVKKKSKKMGHMARCFAVQDDIA